jgi:probable rRNA maturation factor
VNNVDVSATGVEVPSWIAGCADFVAAVLEERGIADWEVSILLCDDRFITDLNERYRGIKAPTDVLSFAQLAPDSPPVRFTAEQNSVAGDIVISVDSLRRQAKENGEQEETELKRLLVHGILHLQGLEHPGEEDSRMIGIQEEVLARLAGVRIFR